MKFVAIDTVAIDDEWILSLRSKRNGWYELMNTIHSVRIGLGVENAFECYRGREWREYVGRDGWMAIEVGG